MAARFQPLPPPPPRPSSFCVLGYSGSSMSPCPLYPFLYAGRFSVPCPYLYMVVVLLLLACFSFLSLPRLPRSERLTSLFVGGNTSVAVT